MGAEAGATRRRPLGLAARVTVIAVLLLFLALLVYGLASRAPNAGLDERLASKRPAAAPRFELPVLQRGVLGPALSRSLAPALADHRVAINELRGTPVVLNFWASWCVPCRAEAPLLERGWRREGRREGVLFLGLNMQDLTGDARAFMREFHNTYTNVRDESNGVARRWGVTGIPETFFIDRRGEVVGHVIGVVSRAQLRSGVDASRSGRVLGSEEGGEQRPAHSSG